LLSNKNVKTEAFYCFTSVMNGRVLFVSIVVFGKRIKPTSSRCFLGNANGPLYALKNLSCYTSDIYKEWFLAFYYKMITKRENTHTRSSLLDENAKKEATNYLNLVDSRAV
jgi:quinol-cytochrome oxidoreductase complex cytochrome b subunit